MPYSARKREYAGDIKMNMFQIVCNKLLRRENGLSCGEFDTLSNDIRGKKLCAFFMWNQVLFSQNRRFFV
jgi:hypothetical protein